MTSISSTPSPELSPKRQAKRKNTADFWRAMRYVAPYRRIVAISVICAFFVGMATAGGLGTMVPILSVLINGDTGSDWAAQRIVEKGFQIDMALEGDDLRVVRVARDGLADRAGLHKGDYLANK